MSKITKSKNVSDWLWLRYLHEMEIARLAAKAGLWYTPSQER